MGNVNYIMVGNAVLSKSGDGINIKISKDFKDIIASQEDFTNEIILNISRDKMRMLIEDEIPSCAVKTWDYSTNVA